MEKEMRDRKTLVLLSIVGLTFAINSVSLLPQSGTMPAGVHEMKAANGTPVLVDAKMMTLYTFAKDTPSASNCNDGCAKNWPPLMASADAKPTGDWTVVTRADRTKQWAYKGMPLYGWIKDSKPGETTGEGLGNGAWKVARP
jgi:predicted lipoprotein with Yx(FWY)xxD motif